MIWMPAPFATSANAAGAAAAEIGVLADDRDTFDLGVLLQIFAERDHHVLVGRIDAERPIVAADARQFRDLGARRDALDHRNLRLRDDRHRGERRRAAMRADDGGDFRFDQPVGDIDRFRRVAAIVERHDLDLLAEHAAGRIDLVPCDLDAPSLPHGRGRRRPRVGRAESNHNRIRARAGCAEHNRKCDSQDETSDIGLHDGSTRKERLVDANCVPVDFTEWRAACKALVPMEMSFTYFLQLTVNGVMLGLLYALIAVGLALIFGVMEIINFAHGELLMLGAFAMAFALPVFGLRYWPAAAAGRSLATAALGLVVYELLLRGSNAPNSSAASWSRSACR